MIKIVPDEVIFEWETSLRRRRRVVLGILGGGVELWRGLLRGRLLVNQIKRSPSDTN